MNNPCKCGCDKKVSKPGNRYMHGHNRKGKPSGMKGKHHSRETKKRMSIHNITKQLWREPEYRRKKVIAQIGNRNALGFQHTKETKEKMSRAGKKRWQNPKYKTKQLKAIMEGLDFGPTKPERRLRNGLNKMFPGEYKYVGDGSFWIAGKNPDFINVNNQKKIIELFGDFWHGTKYRLLAFNDNSSNEKHENQRIKHFAKYGFRILIVWERELKNIRQLKKKLLEFHTA